MIICTLKLLSLTTRPLHLGDSLMNHALYELVITLRPLRSRLLCNRLFTDSRLEDNQNWMW